jgi:hypothetical protein
MNRATLQLCRPIRVLPSKIGMSMDRIRLQDRSVDEAIVKASGGDLSSLIR